MQARRVPAPLALTMLGVVALLLPFRSTPVYGQGRIDLRLGDDIRIDGAAPGDFAGDVVAGVGDVNGDGRADILVGALGADSSRQTDNGSAYVVFGQASSAWSVDLGRFTHRDSRLKIDGVQSGDQAGSAVAGAGDVNGDGLKDVIVGAEWANSTFPSGLGSGSAYLIYGRPGPPEDFNLFTLGDRGFRMDGAQRGDHAGASVAGAGDVNGDGHDDLIVGSPQSDNNGRLTSGSAYVIYGRAGPQPNLRLADLGDRGFRIDGAGQNDFAGVQVAGAGDVNGDGLTDIIVGARPDNNGGRYSGAAYVIYGRSGPQPNVDLGDLGDRGFRIDGAPESAPPDSFGAPEVAGAGDLNGDGLKDIIVGTGEGFGHSGAAYVIYGRSGLQPNVDVAALGERGFRIKGRFQGGMAGSSVAGAGDVNGDRHDDVIVGAPGTTLSTSAGPPFDPGRFQNGSAYVIYGRAGPQPDVDLDALVRGADLGFVIEGAAERDFAGWAVAGAGDMNGDGRGEVIVSANRADNNGREDSGSVYLIGNPPTSEPPALIQIPLRPCTLEGSELAGSRRPGEFASGDSVSGLIAAANDRSWLRHARVLLRTASASGLPVIADPFPPGPGDRDHLGDVEERFFGVDEPALAIVACERAWQNLDPRQKGIVVVLPREISGTTAGFAKTADSQLQVGGAENARLCTQKRQLKVGDVGTWAVVEEPARLGNNVTEVLVHELGHALLLGHGNGLDDNSNGTVPPALGERQYDQFCERQLIWPKEDDLTPRTNCSDTGSVMLAEVSGCLNLRPLQVEQARAASQLIPGALFSSAADPAGTFVAAIGSPLPDIPGDVLIAKADFAETPTLGVTEIFQTVMGALPSNARNRYSTFLDLDNDPATGCSPAELGLPTRFDGAELVTSVDVEITNGALQSLEARVWRCEGKQLVPVSDPAIRARASDSQVADSQEPASRLFARIVIELPTALVGQRADEIRLQAASEQLEASGQHDRLPNGKDAGGLLVLPAPSLPQCSVGAATVNAGSATQVRASGLPFGATAEVWIGSDVVARGSVGADGQLDTEVIVPHDSRTGLRPVMVQGQGSLITATCEIEVTASVRGADLSVVKSDSPDPVRLGEALTYTIVVTNDGPDRATGVTVNDNLPSTVGIVTTAASQGPGCVHSAGTVTCDLGVVESGQSATVAITVTAGSMGTIENRATVGAAESDPDTANNATEEGTVVAEPLTCGGVAATLMGSEDDDILVGTPGNDVINGLGGNDVITGAGGNDVICGGDGNDLLIGGAGADRLFGEGGRDVLSGGSGGDALDGGANTDICFGGPGGDTAANCERHTFVPLHHPSGHVLKRKLKRQFLE